MRASTKTPALPAELLLLLGASLIAFAPIAVREAGLAPLATAFWRCLLGAPVLALALMLLPAPVPAERPALWQRLGLAALAGFFFCGDLVLWHLAIEWSTIAKATLFANLTPVPVVLLAWLLFGERPGWRFALGLALALGGAACVMHPAFAPSGTGYTATNLLGDLMGLLTALFYGGYQIAIAWGRRKLGLSTAELMLGSTATAAIWTLLVLPLEPAGKPFWPQSPESWLILLALGGLIHAGGQGLVAASLGRLSSGFAAIGLLWQPALVCLLGWVLYQEDLDLLEGLGIAMILGGIVQARLSRA